MLARERASGQGRDDVIVKQLDDDRLDDSADQFALFRRVRLWKLNVGWVRVNFVHDVSEEHVEVEFNIAYCRRHVHRRDLNGRRINHLFFLAAV